MAGKKGHSGGHRVNTGRPPNSVRAVDTRRDLALAAAEYTQEALQCMVKLMRTCKNPGVKLMAAAHILDRAVGKAPLQVDVTALRHTEVVYESAMEIRRELERRGVPPILIEHLSSISPEPEPIDATSSELSDGDARAAN